MQDSSTRHLPFPIIVMLKMIDVFPPNAYDRLVFLGNLRVGVSCGDGNTYHFIGKRIALIEIDQHVFVLWNNLFTPHLLLFIIIRRTFGRIANIRKAFLGIRTSNWMVKELAIHSKADSKRVLARILTIGASVKN